MGAARGDGIMRALLDYLIYVSAFCVIGVGALGAWDAVSHEPPVVAKDLLNAAAAATAVLPEPFPGRSKVTVLIVGADERPEYGDVGRSDTMILLFLNPRTKQAALLSIPRDLLVYIPGHGTNKINASFSLGGMELVRETVEGLLEIDIDYTAKADFGGFVDIVDMLGGVDLEVPDVEGRGRGMNYDDNWGKLHIHLKPGLQHLDGEQAMGFVRYRRGDSDFKRSERQHQFLRAMVEQKLKVSKIPQLVRVTPKVLEAIDTDMSWRDAVDLARVLREMRVDSLLSVSLQPYLRDRRNGHGWCVEISESSLNQVLAEINQHLNTTPGQLKLVEVLNGSGQTGVAAAAGSALSGGGFEILDIGNAASFDYQRTQIHYPAEGLSAARRVQALLGVGELIEIDADSSYGRDRITVIVGADLKPHAIDASG